jgi:hypothetical protein
MANYLTSEDRAAYGDDLLNVSQRAAMQAVAPYIQQLEQQNNALRQRQARDSKRLMDQQLEAAVPEFREVDRDSRWHQWLLERDALSGEIRQTLLNQAVASGDTPRVISFFRGFQRTVGGQSGGTSTRTSPPLGMILHRTKESSSRGRTYDRSEIKRLYDAHRRGAYQGREAEWARQEADIFAAQRDGRFRDYDFVSK